MEEVKGIEKPEDGATENVWTPVDVAVTTYISRPFPEDVANVCEATDEPSRDVIVPPAPPASVPQKNAPFAQRSFSVELLQEESDAPKRLKSVVVAETFKIPVVKLLDVRLLTVVVAR